MATKPKAKTATAPVKGKTAAPAIDKGLLANIVQATLSDSFVYTTPAQHQPLIDAGLVEVNADFNDGNGGLGTRATQAGIDAAPEGTTAGTVANTVAAPAQAVASSSQFVVQSGIPVPPKMRLTGNTSRYPFNTMEVGQSFFVPATEEKPNAAKAMASTLSSANERYKQRDAEGNAVKDENGNTVYDRHFMVQTVIENNVKGARVWRDA